MNWSIKIISKTLMTKISHISWGGYDKGFYGIFNYMSIFSVGADADSNEDIYYSDIVAKTFTAYSSSLYNRSSFVTDYYYTKRDIKSK